MTIAADVVHGDELLDAHLAGAGVDLDLGDLAAEGVHDRKPSGFGPREPEPSIVASPSLSVTSVGSRRARRHASGSGRPAGSRSSAEISNSSPASWSSVLLTFAAAERTAGGPMGSSAEPPATGP